MAPQHRPSAFFLGSGYAGHATRFANLRQHVESDERLASEFRTVTGWRPGGRIESLPVLPPGIRGRLRSWSEAAAFVRFPRPDVIWTSCRTELAPFSWSQLGPLHRPMVLDIDATARQLERMAPDYFERSPREGLSLSLLRKAEALHWRAVSIFTPWSNWARRGLEAEGIESERIRVLPPGVDLERWKPVRRESGERPLRVLFVGGDFRRKGGDMLIAAVARRPEAIEATFVTRDDPGPLPHGSRWLVASANSPELLDAYARADLFVLPTRAECFGIATVEAMASALPVITTDVGGAEDIVEDGVTGWLIAPEQRALEDALDAALAQRADLAAIGARGRERAERLFNGARNDRVIVELMLELVK